MRFLTIRNSFASLLFAAACGGGTTTIEPPPPPPTNFSVVLKPDAEDLGAGLALGWTNGIPNASVTLTPRDSSAAPRTMQSSSTGVADFGTVSAGTYIVEAARWLSAAEMASLPAGEGVNGWVARSTVVATGQGLQKQILVPASRRKGLIISEWAFNMAALPPVNEIYEVGGYLELYNNGSTTIYLDSLIVAEGWWASLDAPSTPCTATEPFRNDPAGIWTRFFQQFPGSGHDYPMAPGQTIVIATDAIDHSAFVSLGIDLSHADFEFAGVADADNPAVPNMRDIGLLSYPSGHGATYFGLVNVPFISRPVDVASLPRARGLSGTAEYARFPAEQVIDAFAIGTNYPPSAGGYADCPPLVNHRFDRQESRLRGSEAKAEYVRSLSRRQVPGTGGPVLLQWSRSGNADFIRTLRTPGRP